VAITSPQKSKIDCATLFPRIAAIIRKDDRDRYLNHWEIAQRLRADDFVQNLATSTRNENELDIGSKVAALFGAQYTRRSMRFGMGRYRHEFDRKREGGCWEYKVSENWAEQREMCYLCEKVFELTDKVFQKELLYGKISIKGDIKWKDMVLTVFAKNSKDEEVLLCKDCFSSAISCCFQEVRRTNIPMTEVMQFRGF
jgi:hypothetical protein